MDNLNTHSQNSLCTTFGAEAGQALWSRFTVHYTPKHGSWLNPAEIEASLWSHECHFKLDSSRGRLPRVHDSAIHSQDLPTTPGGSRHKTAPRRQAACSRRRARSGRSGAPE
ncbi:MAG: transposase [Nannocystis sp.]|nr:transposase [Nannocystis sp.]